MVLSPYTAAPLRARWLAAKRAKSPPSRDDARQRAWSVSRSATSGRYPQRSSVLARDSTPRGIRWNPSPAVGDRSPNSATVGALARHTRMGRSPATAAPFMATLVEDGLPD